MAEATAAQPVAPWHYVSLSRSVAERLLVDNGNDGAFLVRDSESVSGASVLSVGSQGRVHHYRLRNESGGVRMEGEGMVHKSLPDLIDYCKTSNALVCQLTVPIILEPSHESENDDEEDAPESTDIRECSTVDVLDSIISSGDGRRDEFHTRLNAYVTDSACADSEALKAAHPTQLNALFAEMSTSMCQELAQFTNKLERMRQVFVKARETQGVGSLLTTLQAPPPGDMTPESIIARLQFAKELFSDTQNHAEHFLKDAICEHTRVFLEQNQQPSNHANVKVFNCKRVEARVGGRVAKGTTTCLTVNVTAGTVADGKGMGAAEDDKVYTHNQLVQLIKSRSDQRRLGVKFEKQRKDYVFASAQAREAFCQMVQLTKNMLQPASAASGAGEHFATRSFFIGSFNMAETTPPRDLSSWFNCQGDGITLPKPVKHDLYAIGTQESALSDKDWAFVIRRHIGDDYQQVALVSLWQIRIAVFAKSSVFHEISHVQTSSVATGIANALGNKGAVGVSMFIGGTSLCFINCHLAANAEKWKRRNANFMDIVSRLQLGQKRLSVFDCTNQFHHCIWFGDLNYRLNLPIKTVLENIPSRNWPLLLKADQLTRQRAASSAFFGFEEGDIRFAPTYRYERGTRSVYAYEKHKGTHIRINVPSWCDRVLWRSFPNAFLKQTSYGCTNDIVISDHSPVFATFDVSIARQYVSSSPQGPRGHHCVIIMSTIVASLHTTSKSNFYLEIFGSCFEGSTRTGVNHRFEPTMQGTCPLWEDAELPTVTPLIPDRAFLENEHLLVAVKSEDSDESYGEACISLMWLFGDKPCHFSALLTHRGEHMGELMGQIHIINSVGESMIGALSINADDDEDMRLSLGERTSVGERTSTAAKAAALRASSRRSSVAEPAAAPAPAPQLLGRKLPHVHAATGRPATICMSRRDMSKFRISLSDLPPASQEAIKTATDVPTFLAALSLEHEAGGFIENGYDDLEFLAEVEEQDLTALGFLQPTDIALILRALALRKAASAV
eukprot:m.39953 g.39953  ORF g.39953 m.39953 type:complete len:1013 (+) comp11326_c0_seq1:218-3256(+)